MKTTLIEIVLKKEVVHWKRMWQMFSIMEGVAGKLISYPIIVGLITVFHFAFAGMHLLFEIFMYIFFNEQFKQNIVNINQKLINRKLQGNEI